MISLGITTFLLLISLSVLNASELLKVSGEIVNPACIKLMQPWLSESADSPVIIKSVVLDTCQNSNLAFSGQSPTVDDNGTVSYCEDPNDAHSCFAYLYLGKTLKGTNYIFHNGTIGAYTITRESVITDLQKNTIKSVGVINKLGDSFIPCFQFAIVKNDTLIVKARKYSSDKPRAFQCSSIIETLIIK